MGRLPANFAGRIVTARAPWVMSGELVMTSAQQSLQFPDSTFLNSTDRPFEIHRMIPFCVAQDSSGTALPGTVDQDLLCALIRTRILDLGKSQALTKSSTLLRALVKGSSEFTWEWADPYYLVKSEQFQVTNDALTFPAIVVSDVDLAQIKVSITFEGFFVTIGAASDAR